MRRENLSRILILNYRKTSKKTLKSHFERELRARNENQSSVVAIFGQQQAYLGQPTSNDVKEPMDIDPFEEEIKSAAVVDQFSRSNLECSRSSKNHPPKNSETPKWENHPPRGGDPCPPVRIPELALKFFETSDGQNIFDGMFKKLF